MIKTSSGLPQKSLAIFDNLWKSMVINGIFKKMFGNVHVSGQKSLENRQKCRHQYFFVIKRTLHVSWKT